MHKDPPPRSGELQTLLLEAAHRLQAGDLAAAEQACKRARRLAPEEPEVMHLGGLIAHRRNDLAGAKRRLHQAVAARPDVARFHNSLGVVLRDLDDLEAARHSLEQAIKLRPGFAGAFYNLGLVRENLNDHSSALGAYESACEHDPSLAGAHHARGMVLQALGRLEETEAALRRALEIQPEYPEAHYHLAHARRADRIDDSQLAEVEALAARRGWPPQELAWLCLALGKLNDDVGRYNRAFDAYQRANGLVSAEYDPNARDERVRRLTKSYSADRLRQLSPAALERTDRIFIVGMPRSGTTLLERLLARHPDVAAGGERMELLSACTQAAQTLGLSEPEQWVRAEPDILRQAADILDSQLEEPSDACMLVDKLPGNIWRLGVVGLLMPRAPILLAWRDPRDVGLSCYFTRFEKGQNFSYDLYHCGRQIRAVQRLAEHWLAALPNPVHVVSYQSLVTQPETTIREALACCGLDPSHVAQAPARGQDVVTTASSWQVRQDLYRHAIDRWRHYEEHLEPLLRGLGSLDLDHPPRHP